VEDSVFLDVLVVYLPTVYMCFDIIILVGAERFCSTLKIAALMIGCY